MGGWRGTLGAYHLNTRSRGFPWKSDGRCLGEKRCSREVKYLTRSDVIRQCWEMDLVGRWLYVMELIRFRGDKQEGCVFLCNAPSGGGEKPGSGSNYLSLLIHVGLQAACSMVTCSGLSSTVLEKIAQNPVFHFAFRVQLEWASDSYLSSLTGVFSRQIHLRRGRKGPRVR